MPAAGLALWLALASLPPVPDCLPLSDLDRFPAVEVATRSRLFGAAVRAHYQFRLDTEPHRQPELRLAAEQAWLCWAAWNALEDAGLSYRGEGRRRESLGILRCLIGDENYRLGVMPDPAPWWLFDDVTGCPLPPPAPPPPTEPID